MQFSNENLLALHSNYDCRLESTSINVATKLILRIISERSQSFWRGFICIVCWCASRHVLKRCFVSGGWRIVRLMNPSRTQSHTNRLMFTRRNEIVLLHLATLALISDFSSTRTFGVKRSFRNCCCVKFLKSFLLIWP